MKKLVSGVQLLCNSYFCSLFLSSRTLFFSFMHAEIVEHVFL
jgi:hypothetical protein